MSGAALGVGSTLVVEAVRARRDRASRLEEMRRTAYVKFLTALMETEAALQTLALSRTTPVGLADTWSAYRDSVQQSARTARSLA